MNSIKFDYKDSCLIEISKIQKISQQLIPEIEYVQDQIGNGYANPYGSVNLPADNPMHYSVEKLVSHKKLINPKCIVVCGIGGSNLGTIAITAGYRFWRSWDRCHFGRN